jgi:hypothetical protein
MAFAIVFLLWLLRIFTGQAALLVARRVLHDGRIGECRWRRADRVMEFLHPTGSLDADRAVAPADALRGDPRGSDRPNATAGGDAAQRADAAQRSAGGVDAGATPRRDRRRGRAATSESVAAAPRSIHRAVAPAAQAPAVAVNAGRAKTAADGLGVAPVYLAWNR